MGFSLSWLATKGKPPETVLAELGLRATGVEGIAGESPALGATTATDWYLIVLDAAEHRLIGADVVARLSRGCEVLTCTVEEHVMFSQATGWRDGREEWRVTHRGEDGPVGLDARGDLPVPFPAIRDELTARQAAEGGADADVDHLFDIPVVLVQAFTGFRHDEDGPDGESPVLEVLASAQSAPATKPSWFGRLLGR
jgi:hypothetical protein